MADRLLQKCLFCLSISLLLTQGIEKTEAQTYAYGFQVHCRKFIPGGPGFMNFFIEVPMTVPGVQVGWGEVKHYSQYDPNHNPHHSSCNGLPYPYGTVTIDPAWTVNHPFFGQVTGGNTRFFFDWVYEDYNQPAGLDYSQNCHGYAFDKGDWPDSAYYLVSFIPFANNCFVPCYPNEASKVSDLSRHSLKVTGTMCPDPFIPLIQKPRYITSSEQYATSGIYTRANGCPFGLDEGGRSVVWAHRAEKWDWQPNWSPTQFSGYKPRN